MRMGGCGLFFFSSRRRHTRYWRDWSSDVCSSDLESLLMGINDVAVSSGSACTSATLEPSYVLKALGAGDDLAHSSIRFGLGRFNTEEEVDYVSAKVIDVVKDRKSVV